MVCISHPQNVSVINFPAPNANLRGVRLKITKDTIRYQGQKFDFSGGHIQRRFDANNRNNPSVDQRTHFGYYEIKCKMPKGRGFWPAFWLFEACDNCCWPGACANGSFYNEIDFPETSGDRSETATSTITAMHYVFNGCIANTNCSSMQSTQRGPAFVNIHNTGFDMSADFNTYGIDWQSTHVDYYINGVFKLRRTNTDYGGFLPQNPMLMMADIAIDPDESRRWPIDLIPANTQFMDIDYIRFYRTCNAPLVVNCTTVLQNITNRRQTITIGGDINCATEINTNSQNKFLEFCDFGLLQSNTLLTSNGTGSITIQKNN